MKKLKLSLFLIMGFAASCSMMGDSKAYKNAIFDAAVQRGSAGREEGGRWVSFHVKLLNPPEAYVIDSLWVNNFGMPVEQTSVGDTTYLTAFYFDPEATNTTALLNDTAYAGYLFLKTDDKKDKVNIGDFKILPPLAMP